MVRIYACDPITNQIPSLKEGRVQWESPIGHQQLLFRVIGGLIKLKVGRCGANVLGAYCSRGEKWQRRIAQGNYT